MSDLLKRLREHENDSDVCFYTGDIIELAADEIERLKDEAIHNEGVMVALREGYNERGKRIEELEDLLKDDLDYLLSTYGQIDAAVEWANDHPEGHGWLVLHKFSIKRCGNPSWGEDHTHCPTCRKYTCHGWVMGGGEDE